MAMNLIDGFLFDSVTETEENAIIVVGKILSRVLGKEMTITGVNTEKVYNGLDSKYHAIRLDAFITAEESPEKVSATVYDLEIENRASDRPDLPKRQRYYSALVDTKCLETSKFYRDLPNYVSITILSYDPFLLGDMYYESRSRLISHPDNADVYNDGVVNIFLYAHGEVNTPDINYGNHLKEMLQYIVTGNKPNNPDSDIDAIDNVVTKVKQKSEVTTAYMKQWERERILQIETAEKTKQENGLEIVRFNRENGISDDQTREFLSLRLRLKSEVINELFDQVNSEEFVQ